MSKEALQLALDALETAHSQTCSVGRPKDWKQLIEAITAIKQVLAAPVQDEFDIRGMLAAKLTCWNRLRETEANELVALVAGLTQPAPVQEPVLKPLSKKWKWVLHESFADVADFDEEGIPSFYWKESVTKFKSGELSVPCKGKNCGSMNGWLHSVECRAEHEAQYTTPPEGEKK